MTLHVGFTGGRRAPTPPQLQWIRDVLTELFEPDATLHHGDCVGKDAAAHDAALKIGYRVVIHPPDVDFFRAHCTHGASTIEVRPPRPYLMRNNDIIRESSVLVAVPDSSPRVRSGTWYTVRRASALPHIRVRVCPHIGADALEVPAPRGRGSMTRGR